MTKNPFMSAPLPVASYDVANHVDDFDIAAKSKEQLRQLTISLARGDQACRKLAAKLQRCYDKNKKCGLWICPKCLRRVRRIIVGQIVRLFEELGLPIHTVSLASADWIMPVGGLDAEKLAAFTESIRKNIERSPLWDAVTFGGWDFSVNAHIHARDDAYWQPHLYLIVATDLPKSVIAKTFDSLVVRSPDVPTPRRIKRATNLWQAVNYVIKVEFKRRIRHRDKNMDAPIREKIVCASPNYAS